MKRSAFLIAIVFVASSVRVALGEPAQDDFELVPRPASVHAIHECAIDPGALVRPLQAVPALIGGAADLDRERFAALGIVPDPKSAPVSIRFSIDYTISAQGYALHVGHDGVHIRSSDEDGAFYALVTLGQLARQGSHNSWYLPCADVADVPALRWRVLSDDVSRGPLPTMKYFKERIRTIASLKMNGYSPYMEHVFVDPKNPLPAPLDGITPGQLHDLDAYAHRFHVAFIPEQQTFAHMHETLKYEKYSSLAETPHGYLLTPENPDGDAYVRDVITDELAEVPHPPFFHIGSDEPSDLGKGLAKDVVAEKGDGPVYTAHVRDMANFVLEKSGARPMIWDDALARHPELFTSLPKQLVFVNWHYGSEQTYKPYIERIARGGFDQMVAPGALNWNEIYPDLDAALASIDRFVTEGKEAGVLGLFQTVWHDDGETLFEASWYPVAYAAASAWEKAPVDRSRFAHDFPRAFFGTTDPRYVADIAALGTCRSLLRQNPREYGDYLFWADPLAADLGDITDSTLANLRLAAEGAAEHLRLASPPLHANAAEVMFLAARRYDALGRDLQIAREAQTYYDDARTLAKTNDGYAYRELNITKYLFWEMRDALLALEPLHRKAWDYEDRSSHEESALIRYRIAAELAIVRADRVSDASIALEKRKIALPSFDDLVRP